MTGMQRNGIYPLKRQGLLAKVRQPLRLLKAQLKSKNDGNKEAQAPFIWVFSILQASTIRPLSLSLPSVADDNNFACWGCGNPVGNGPRNWSLLLLLLGIVARDRRQSNPVPTRAIVATSVQSTSSSSANLFNKVCFSSLFKNVSFC